MGCVWSGEAGSTYRGWMGWDSWSMTMRGRRYRHMYSMCVHSYSMWYFCPSPLWRGTPLILHIKVCLGLRSTTASARCANYLEWSHLSRASVGSEDALHLRLKPWGYISRCEQNIWISGCVRNHPHSSTAPYSLYREFHIEDCILSSSVKWKDTLGQRSGHFFTLQRNAGGVKYLVSDHPLYTTFNNAFWDTLSQLHRA